MLTPKFADVIRRGIKMKNSMRRVWSDLKYIIFNCFVNHIPVWGIRKFIYKLAGMKIGKGARIGIWTIIVNPSNIVIGGRSKINEFCHIDGRGGVHIGEDVSISIYTKMITGSHDMYSKDFAYADGNIEIQDHVWIGAGAIILNGTILEEKSVIGSGCIFKGRAERGMIYMGNPARPYGKRNLEEKYQLKQKWFFR